MRQYGVEDGQEPLEGKRLGSEQSAGDLPVFGGAAVGRERGAAAALAAFGEGGFGEEGEVVFWGVVGGEVGGEEEVGGVVGEGVGGVWCWVSGVTLGYKAGGGGEQTLFWPAGVSGGVGRHYAIDESVFALE